MQHEGLDGRWTGSGDDTDHVLHLRGGAFVLRSVRETNHGRWVWWKRGQFLANGTELLLWVTEARRSGRDPAYRPGDEVLRVQLSATEDPVETAPRERLLLELCTTTVETTPVCVLVPSPPNPREDPFG